MSTLDERLLMRLPEEAQPLMRFVCTRMVHSYKPVLTRIFLRRLPRLTFPFSEVAEEFVAFYRERIEHGLPVERAGCPFVTKHGLDEERAIETAKDVLRHVFCRAHDYACIGAGMCMLSLESGWTALCDQLGRRIAADLMNAALKRFYSRILDGGEAIYVQQEGERQYGAGELVFHLSDTDDEQPLLVLRADDDEVSE